ncbi:hypothetical protein ACHAXR_003816 [Thalassiosira sp. AJA248-18]
MSYQFSTTTSLSDETYLESFVESISASLPNELRRNLEHLRDLDNSSCKLMEDWRERQDGCLKGVEETLLKGFREEAVMAAAAAAAASSTDTTPNNHTHEKRGAKRKQQQLENDSTEKSPEKKVACVKCRAKKVRCNGKQPYCLRRRLNATPTSVGRGGGGDGNATDNDSGPKTQTVEETQKNDQGGSSVASQLSTKQVSAFLQERGPPTREEIRTTLEKHNPHYDMQRGEITSMYHELKQYSKEKINTANQLKSMVDMALGRLNRDMEKFEKELGIDSTSSSSAAAVVGANNYGGGGNLGAVSHHAHAASGGGVMSGAGVHPHGNNSTAASMTQSGVSATATTAPANSSLRRSTYTPSSAVQHPPSSALHQPYPTMRGVVPPPPKSVQSANLAAIQVTPNSPDWILAKIISHDKSNKMYTLSDEDVQSNQKYTIPDKQVVALKGTERNKWVRGDTIYAVYPDTTSFYHATVSTPPFNGFVMVHFKDDWDANGVTHEKAVLLQHAMKVPPGGK